MIWLIGLIPALGWGILPIVLRRLGGSVSEQLLGTTLGTMLLVVCLLPFVWTTTSLPVAWLCFLSGISWGLGQCGQYYGYRLLGVSEAMPISSGLQIAGNTLFGGILFNEWQSSRAFIVGLIGIGLILSGIILGNGVPRKGKHNRGYVLLVLTTVGYWGYSVLPKLAQTGDSQYMRFAYQALGMVCVSLGYYIYGRCKHDTQRISIRTFRLLGAGVIFGAAAFAYLYTLSTQGLIFAFTLSQMNVIVATLLGIWLLDEQPRLGKIRCYCGLGVIIVGSLLLL